MSLQNAHVDRVVRTPSSAATQATTGPDLSWKGLYRIGGITAILYIVLALVVPYIQLLTSDTDLAAIRMMDGVALLEFLSTHAVWWLVIQVLVLGSSILAVIAFAALFVALKNVDKSNAAVGAIIAVTCQILFIAYLPVLMGQIYLAEQYPTSSEAQRIALVGGMESLIAINNAFNPTYEVLFAFGILFLSLAMLRGLFHKWVGWLGILTWTLLWSPFRSGRFWVWVTSGGGSSS